jgi:hypothetical protein
VSNHFKRYVLAGALLLLMMVLQACTVSPAPKVQCDSQLRPINPQPQQP